MVGLSAGDRNFSPCHRVQTVSGVHSASYPIGTGGPSVGSKSAGAWSYTFTPHTSSRRGALVSKWTTLLHILKVVAESST